MGILKDWREDNEGYRFRCKLVAALSPKVWFRLHRWRMERANRGWSYRDTWGAGDHVAKMTAEMLQHLNDNTYTDWPEWFKLNVKEEGRGAYKNLQSVIDDIISYLDYTEGDGWIEGLLSKPGKTGKFSHSWYYVSSGRKLTEAEVEGRIKSHAAKEANLYKKAQKAMMFFGRHFAGFWD